MFPILFIFMLLAFSASVCDPIEGVITLLAVTEEAVIVSHDMPPPTPPTGATFKFDLLNNIAPVAVVVKGATLRVSDASVIAPLIAVLLVLSSILGLVILMLLSALIVLFATYG